MVGGYSVPNRPIVFCVAVYLAMAMSLRRGRLRVHEILHQVFVLGVQSLPIVCFALGFVAVLMVLEFSFHMKLVLRQDSLVPAFSTVLMVRELGPVVTCLLMASRVGAGVAAELGAMKNTDQIDALQLVGIQPIEYLAVPRWAASVFVCVCLTIVSVTVAVAAAAFLASLHLGLLPSEFMNTMGTFVTARDIAACILKAFVFGNVLSLAALYQGMHSGRGSRGVGEAATAAVVVASVGIIVADFAVTLGLYAL